MVPSISPVVEDSVFGTVADSPAPLQRLFLQETIVNNSTKASPYLAPCDMVAEASPPPTPIPGTKVPLGDISPPNIMVTCPSAPCIQRESRSSHSDMLIGVGANGYERTRTLDTESGFPIPLYNVSGEEGLALDDAEASMEEVEEADVPTTTAMDSEPDAASFDEPFGSVPCFHDVSAKAVAPPKTNKHGDGPDYVVYDAGSDDDGGGIVIEQAGVNREMVEEVETWIRLMNRSLGG